MPAGHPESFIEAFANIYVNVANTINSKILGTEPTQFDLDFPNVVDGVRGMAFIESIIESAKIDKKWYPIKEYWLLIGTKNGIYKKKLIWDIFGKY